MTIAIRPATLDDAEALATLKRETFRETFVTAGFAIPYPADDLAGFEEASYSAATMRRELADPQRRQWIATQGDAMLGYAHVGPCKLPHAEVTPLSGELYQIYVRNEAQGTGLGSLLLTIALDHLGTTFPGPVWLGVWSGNHRAQAIYAKLGFEKVGEYEFPVGAWRDHEYIFRRS